MVINFNPKYISGDIVYNHKKRNNKNYKFLFKRY